MITYTVIKPFTVVPNNVPLEINDTLVKYEDSVLVIMGSSNSTYVTFYEWVGSPSSLQYLQYTSQEPDTSGGSGVVTPINTSSNYTTTDIVNKINEIIGVI